MNTRTMLTALEAKSNELINVLEDLKNSTTLSANTVRTQSFQKKHELHNLLIMQDLCNALLRNDVEEALDNTAVEGWFNSVTTLTAERKAKYILTVKEGDKIMDLLQEHKDMKDVWGKIMKSMDEQGLHIEDGVIVR